MMPLKDRITATSNVLVIAGALFAGVSWLGGGFEPLQMASAKALAIEVRTLQTTVEDLQKTIAMLPRPSDYAGQDARIGRIEGHIDAVGTQIVKDESDARASRIETDAAIQAVKDRVLRLEAGTGTPVRQPR